GRRASSLLDRAQDRAQVRASYRMAMTALRRRRHVELHAFRGYGTRTRLLVRGRVLRASGLTRSRLGDSGLDNLRNMFRRFNSDEITRAQGQARCDLRG